MEYFSRIKKLVNQKASKQTQRRIFTLKWVTTQKMQILKNNTFILWRRFLEEL
jgi:hypothetical protein